MPDEPDQVAARERLHGYLAQTLAALPAGLSLSTRHPDLPKARLHGGVVLPFPDNGFEPVSEYFTVGYWLIGATPGSAARYFDLVLRCWTGFGWPTRVDRASSRTRGADAVTPDGYQLHLQTSASGHLSLSGSTPPFPVGPTG